MNPILEWLANHAEQIPALILALFVFLRLLVGLTPTPKDDAIVAKAYDAVSGSLNLFSKVFAVPPRKPVDVPVSDAVASTVSSGPKPS